MGFCGSCGQRASPEDRFCTECGTPIPKSKFSVLDNAAQVIKEEYRQSTTPPEAEAAQVIKEEYRQSTTPPEAEAAQVIKEEYRQSTTPPEAEAAQVIKEEYRQSTTPPEAEAAQGTHIGDQKKKGEWLEYTTSHILKFAGFETRREVPFVFNDNTGDRFRIDMLATDPNIEIFVECKDYSNTKMSEKIMYTLTGQLDDYRKHQHKTVIGILAMTARDDGRNQGIRESLRAHNCFLWDGSFLEHLENKIVELGNKDDFRRYVLDHLDVFEPLERKDAGDHYDFLIKYSFHTIHPDEYVGKSFHVFNIIDDIKEKLPKNVEIVNQKSNPIKEGREVLSYNVIVDFSLKLTMEEIERFAKSKRKLADKIRRRKPEEIAYKRYRKEMHDMIASVYGVSYNPKAKNRYFEIEFMGSRIE